MDLRNLVFLSLVLFMGLGLVETCQGQGKNPPRRSPGAKAGKNELPGRKELPENPEEEPEVNAAASLLEGKVRDAQEAYADQEFEESIRLTTEVLSVNPRHAVARYQRASALVDLGRQTGDAKRIRAGVADAREALAVAGNQHLIFHIPYFYGLTSLAEIENRKSHAELTVSIAASLLAREDLAEDVRGMVYFQRGLAKVYLKDFKGAAADYSAAIEIDPRFQAAHFGRADAYVRAGDLTAARGAYDKAVSSMPVDPLAYNNRGTFQLQQSRIDLAIADFSKALELEPKFSMAALNRGFAYAQKQSWAEAEANYLAALAADPEQPMALRLLGMARVSQGKLKTALESFTQAVELDNEDPESYSGRGFVRFFAQDYAGAVADFTKAVQLNPEMTMVIPWKYWAQVRAGQADAAKQELQAFIEARSKTPNWHVALARHALGEIDDAGLLAFTKSTTDLNAQKQWLCEAYYFQGVKSETTGQSDAARTAFTECLKTQQTQLTAYMGARLGLARK